MVCFSHKICWDQTNYRNFIFVYYYFYLILSLFIKIKYNVQHGQCYMLNDLPPDFRCHTASLLTHILITKCSVHTSPHNTHHTNISVHTSPHNTHHTNITKCSVHTSPHSVHTSPHNTHHTNINKNTPRLPQAVVTPNWLKDSTITHLVSHKKPQQIVYTKNYSMRFKDSFSKKKMELQWINE